MKIVVSAPGKIMIMGEHAVVHGRPCMVTAVNRRIEVALKITHDNLLTLNASDVGVVNYQKEISNLGKGEIEQKVKFVELALKNFKNKFPFTTGLKISTKADFCRYGFGSSGAVTACVIKGLAELFKININKRDIFDLVYQTILGVQQRGSGFDAAASIYGGTLYFVTGGKVIEQLNTDKLPLVVGYTGVKADTVQLIGLVWKKLAKNPEKVNKIFDKMGELVEKGKKAILEKDYLTLGDLMNQNEKLLEEFGVGTEKLTALIKAALGAGAWGAKLSGAGGGDCIIALVPENKREAVSKAITDVRGEVVEVETGEEGMRVEY